MDMQNQPSPKTVKDQVALLSFIDKLIEVRKDPTTTAESLPKIRELLLTELNDDINRSLISMLSEKDQVALDELLDKNVSDEEIDAFFASKIPNITEEIAAIMVKFKDAYLYPVRKQLEEVAEKKAVPPAPIGPVPMN